LTNTSVGRRWATITETAQYLAVHKRTVEAMIADGRLQAYRLGPRICRIDLNEVDAAFHRYRRFDVNDSEM
jgi:excisionase family DNA binding protein